MTPKPCRKKERKKERERETEGTAKCAAMRGGSALPLGCVQARGRSQALWEKSIWGVSKTCRDQQVHVRV